MTVSAIVPTYCEAEHAPTVVTELEAHGVDEVIVVDDSPDTATAHAVRDVSDDVAVLRRPNGSGLASAVVAGFAHAGGDVVVVMDADGQHPTDRVPALVDAVERGADVAVGSRHRADTPMTADWSIGRYVTSFGGAVLAWAALPPARQHLQDPMSGFFAVDRRVIAPALDADELQPRGFKILLEVLARCPVRRIAEVPAAFHDRAGGESNLDASEYLQFALHTLELAWVYRTTPTVQRLPAEVATDGGS